MRYVVSGSKRPRKDIVEHCVNVYPVLQRPEDSSEDMLCLRGLDHLRVHLEEMEAHWMLPGGLHDHTKDNGDTIDVFYLHGVCIGIYERVHQPGTYTFDAGPQCLNPQTLEPQRTRNEIEIRSWEVEFVSENPETLRKVIRDIIESDDRYINFFKEAYSEGLQQSAAHSN